MGACYSTRVYLLYSDEQRIVKETLDYIRTNARYIMFKHPEEFERATTLMDVLKLIFTDSVYKTDEKIRTKYYKLPEDNCYESDFDAAYFWEEIMIEWFKWITPYLKDHSELYIAPDTSWDELVIIDGKCVQTH